MRSAIRVTPFRDAHPGAHPAADHFRRVDNSYIVELPSSGYE
jgi:hypothetical protein